MAVEVEFGLWSWLLMNRTYSPSEFVGGRLGCSRVGWGR